MLRGIQTATEATEASWGQAGQRTQAEMGRETSRTPVYRISPAGASQGGFLTSPHFSDDVHDHSKTAIYCRSRARHFHYRHSYSYTPHPLSYERHPCSRRDSYSIRLSLGNAVDVAQYDRHILGYTCQCPKTSASRCSATG